MKYIGTKKSKKIEHDDVITCNGINIMILNHFIDRVCQVENFKES